MIQQVAKCSFVMLILISVVGCGSAGTDIEVAGTVAYRGKVVPGGTVLLQPSSGRAIVGMIDETGRYKVSAPRGIYRIGVVAASRLPNDVDLWKSKVKLQEPLVPEKYGRPETSGTSITVAPDSTAVDISLR